MQDNTITDSAGVVWRVTDPTTGRAERVTPLPSRSALRRPAETVRYFPPANTTAPVDLGIPRSLLAPAKEYMLRRLFDLQPRGRDAIRKAVNDHFADVHPSVCQEVEHTYLASPLSMGPKRDLQ
jgi:hypothetical protein